ncbi:hypothetical protein HPT27_01005 [Permianibacter sp. IMCC34836]|uniref:hypothetical protein n=1 Tax=Permianibacter fluminis TaxID=2738515 RepID=UPI001555D857|nr:hypothetical protein [Permianibacter fluminis]NQD35579.1 hypothetical protein [Permianibacter fluminis]
MSRLMYGLFLWFGLCQLAHADGVLDGLWVGIYSSGPQFTETDNVGFSVVLESQGDAISGRLIEVQTFGGEPATGLGAALSGTMTNDVVSLIKKYDGSGGVNHSVHLQLSYSEGDPTSDDLVDGDMLDGEWFIDAKTRGQVRLFRLQ